MKKLIPFLFLFFLVFQVSYGQKRFGIKAGINASNMSIDKEYLKSLNATSEKRFGYQVGVIMQKDIDSKVYLRPEVYYSLEGYKLDDEQDTPVSFNYINVSVLTGYNFNQKFSLFAGPQLGLLGPVYAKLSHGKTGNLRNILNYNSYDLGIAAGTNFMLSSRTSIDLRYNHGFATILTVGFSDASGNEKVAEVLKKNKSLEINFNYFFRPKAIE